MLQYKYGHGFSGVDWRRRLCLAGLLITCTVMGCVLWRDIEQMNRQQELLLADQKRLSALQRIEDKQQRTARQQPVNVEDAAVFSLLQWVEASWAKEISVLRMDADMRKHRLRLQVQAESGADLFGFVASLKPYFGDNVFVERHSEKEDKTDRWLVDANLIMEWQ